MLRHLSGSRDPLNPGYKNTIESLERIEVIYDIVTGLINQSFDASAKALSDFTHSINKY